MLTALCVRDIVLIDRLDIDFEQGLVVLTGETGAGKSILLDALGLALGARGDASLVRASASKGVVTAQFSLSVSHPALALLAEQGIDAGDELVIRRVQAADGKSRAFINDQPVSVNLLRQTGGLLAEIHGQHDDRALVDVANHRRLLDAFGQLDNRRQTVSEAWQALSEARKSLADHEARMAEADAEAAFLEHSAEELRTLAPKAGEEEELASRRQIMMRAEQFCDAIQEAAAILRDDGTLEARLNGALRRLERRRDEAQGHLDLACDSLERVVVELAEAGAALEEAERSFAFEPQELEAAEERLFALRAAARKHKVSVDALPDLLQKFESALGEIEDGGRKLERLREAVQVAQSAYDQVAADLSGRRLEAARRLDAAVVNELGPLRLERARFETGVDSDPDKAGPEGIDRVEFLVSANPGTPCGPLVKVASGGELSRFMLALKVVLASCGSAPTLIFDEIDTGVGGAVADAIGQRLARLAGHLQVLAVTHSPQVAGRADHHLLIAKQADIGEGGESVTTQVSELAGAGRREEIARMLSAEVVTDEARAQAERLLDRAS